MAILLAIAFALIPVAFRIKRKRFALLWIFIGYVIYSIASAVKVALPMMADMSETGVGDSQLVAGAISENIVTSLLLGIIAIPLSFLIFWAFRKFSSKA